MSYGKDKKKEKRKCALTSYIREKSPHPNPPTPLPIHKKDGNNVSYESVLRDEQISFTQILSQAPPPLPL